MTDYKLEEVVSGVIEVHRVETWKDKTQWHQKQTSVSAMMSGFLKWPGKLIISVFACVAWEMRFHSEYPNS